MQKELKLSKNTAKLHKLFGKKLYANKYSFISEICQNAVDSHRMAGVKELVRVGVRYVSSVHHPIFYVKDVGLSFTDKEDFIEKVCTIMESGKSEEKSNDESCPMGTHGIGSISVSAFSPRWKYTVITPDKKKFTCVLEEVDSVGLTYDISDYQETEEERSVLFEVEVNTWTIGSFVAEMKSKLCYFKDILFEFDEQIIKAERQLLTLNTDFEIFETEDFKISTISPSKEMHIALDQYSYPIAWSKLGIHPIPLNIALKFGMNEGLEADLTRENLSHTPNYKEVIVAKIAKVATWFYSKYNESIPDAYESVHKAKLANFSLPCVSITKNLEYNINVLQHYSTVKKKPVVFKDVSTEMFLNFINKNGGLDFFKSEGQITRAGVRSSHINTWESPTHRLFLSKTPSTKMMRYLKHAYKHSYLYSAPPQVKLSRREYMSTLIKRGFEHKVEMKAIYKNTGVNMWRKRCIEFDILVKSAIKDYFVDVNSIVIPADFEAGPKKTIIRKTQGEVAIYYSSPMSRYSSSYNCKFDKKIVEVISLHTIPKLHIYGMEEQREKLDDVYTVIRGWKSKKSITPCIMTEKDINKIKELNLHNFMSVEDFLKGKHRVFRQFITGHLVHTQLVSPNSKVFNNIDIIKEHISSEFAKDLQMLFDYAKKYNSGGNYDPEFMESALKVAHDCKLYDYEVWEKFQNVKERIVKYDFVEFFSSSIKIPYNSELRDRAIVAMKDVAKQRKLRMDWIHYNKEEKEEK